MIQTPFADSPRAVADQVPTPGGDVVKRLLLFLVLIGVALTAAAYWYNPGLRSTGEEGYTLAPVEYGIIVESVSATGQLLPREVTAVASQLPGEVRKIYPEADLNRNVERDNR